MEYNGNVFCEDDVLLTKEEALKALKGGATNE